MAAKPLVTNKPLVVSIWMAPTRQREPRIWVTTSRKVSASGTHQSANAPTATAHTRAPSSGFQVSFTAEASQPASAVDIIVPVYQGLADTQLCILSVLASTNRTPHHLIVINDASPDPELSAWLRDTAAQEPRITLLENSSN